MRVGLQSYVGCCFLLTHRSGVAFEPKGSGCNRRIDTNIFPPCCFIAAAMDLAMMIPAERNGELITDLAAEGLALGRTGDDAHPPAVGRGVGRQI